MRITETLVLIILTTVAPTLSSLADETVVGSVDLPGASLNQEITYSPTKADYEAARDKILSRLKANDKAAFVNPAEGPWMRVETTAKIGFAYKDVGVSQGRKNVRQISAADEALFKYEQWRKNR